MFTIFIQNRNFEQHLFFKRTLSIECMLFGFSFIFDQTAALEIWL